VEFVRSDRLLGTERHQAKNKGQGTKTKNKKTG
jgi:hypothetical protein